MLPAPRHRPAYYACLLLDLSRLLPPGPEMLVRAINTLFVNLERLDAEIALRLADWLAFHISHFGFNLEPFGEAWAARLRATAEAPTGATQAESPHAAFVHFLLDKASCACHAA